MMREERGKNGRRSAAATMGKCEGMNMPIRFGVLRASQSAEIKAVRGAAAQHLPDRARFSLPRPSLV